MKKIEQKSSISTGGNKWDGGKTRLDLISPIAEEWEGRVLTKGAKKYADHNWRKGIAYSRIIGAMKRHLNAISRGEDWDFDPACAGCMVGNCSNHTGCPHAACLRTNAGFLLEFMTTHNNLDDRFKLPKIKELG